MVRQSSKPLTDSLAIHPETVTTPPPEAEGRWHGFGVTRLYSGLRNGSCSELVRSLNPFYEPLNSQPPTPHITGSAAVNDAQGQISHFLQSTALATRAVVAWANLPPEINNLLGYLANLSVAGRFASDQFNPFTSPAGMVTEPGTDRENATDEWENTKYKTRKASKKPRQKSYKFTTTPQRANPLPNTSLALGALVGLCAVGASSASDSARWHDVANATFLGNICRNKDSCSKNYRLIKDIDGSQLDRPIGTKSQPFKGQLDGRNHSINNLRDCLAGNLAGNGHIFNLRFIKANISKENINSNTLIAAGVVACEMADEAWVSNIQTEHAHIKNKGNNIATAIGVGHVEGGKVTNIHAINCTVEALGELAAAGIGAGYLNKGSVTDTTARYCKVETKGVSTNAGIGAGMSTDGVVINTNAAHCAVATTVNYANAGIGVGYQDRGTVTGTTAVNCTVTTTKDNADAGIGVGENAIGTVTDTIAINCKVKTSGKLAYAGIGAGKHEGGEVTNTIAANCLVSTTEEGASASIGAGYFYETSVANTRAIHSTVRTERASATISGEKNPVMCNVSINGDQKGSVQGCESWRRDCKSWLGNDLCANITSRLSTPTTPGTLASLNGNTKVFIVMATVIFVLVGLAVVICCYYRHKSSANAGRNAPMPGDQPRSGRQRGAPPQDRHRVARQADMRLQPARDHYQPLIFNRGNTRSLPAPPQSRYQQLLFRQGNAAAGGRNPMMGTDNAPVQHSSPESHLYQELEEHECTDHHGEPVANGQAVSATVAANPVANTDNGPISSQERPLSPIYQVLTKETDSDHSHDEPAVVPPADMARGGSSPTTNAGKEPDHGQISDDNPWVAREPR
ncbi:hypothetical protein [Endozoicomonas sp. ONNA2]|uniref:hypothetical protein n=1 Tax=Endozoicomonas sp. ONNA2 TaxID=2828741 RepID=UPI002148510A|nr:hypothetical protein [Endozoicomonas sp. ONNA2]